MAPVAEIKLSVADKNSNRAHKDCLPIRILLAQSQTPFRIGLRSLLEREPDLQVVAEAADGPQAIYQANEVKPDILLIDENILESARAAILEHADGNGSFPRIFVLGSSDGKDKVENALQMGVWGFASKESPTGFLIDGIRGVMAGKRWPHNRPPGQSGGPQHGSQEDAPGAVGEKPFGLTKREMAVISVVIAGHSNKEIARKLHISEDTVKHHLTHIFDKIGVYNRLELALFAIHHGLNEAT